jgi:predicted nuclease of predicted toxin-antitoxin system
MRLLVDMNLSPRWVELMVASGIEAVHWSTLGAVDATDAAIMTLARNKGYVVLTHVLDFSAILATTCGSKPSVVQIRSGDVSPDGIGSMVIGALGQMAAELEQGALLTIDPGRMRLRLLPLHRDGQYERL